MNNEILLIDKPAGMTSFGVVARVRRVLSEQAGWVTVKRKDGVVRQKRKKVKVGHTGTLDPFATGLLIILTSAKTKQANEFLKLDKEYVATVRLGAVSTTGDPEGEVTILKASDQSQLFSEPAAARPVVTGEPGFARSPLVAKSSEEEPNLFLASDEKIVPSRAQVETVVNGFVGEIEQTVPAFSAVKINGQRAYKLAREGKDVAMPRRKVKIYEIEILRYEWPELEIRCKVSSGTYIRTLGEDIGKVLGVGAYLTALRRTQVGKYRVEDAVELEKYLGSERSAPNCGE